MVPIFIFKLNYLPDYSRLLKKEKKPIAFCQAIDLKYGNLAVLKKIHGFASQPHSWFAFINKYFVFTNKIISHY